MLTRAMFTIAQDMMEESCFTPLREVFLEYETEFVTHEETKMMIAVLLNRDAFPSLDRVILQRGSPEKLGVALENFQQWSRRFQEHNIPLDCHDG
jgi:hypothetical protein